MADCSHHWLIDKANGPISNGLCKLCGEERPFLNSWDSAVEKKFLRTNHQTGPSPKKKSKALQRLRHKNIIFGYTFTQPSDYEEDVVDKE